MGKKSSGAFAGEIINRFKQRRPGVRGKHWMNENWIKMYDKFGMALRVATVVNNLQCFRVLCTDAHKDRQ